MTDNFLRKPDLATQQDVITLCDYEMCPTIKSDNEAITLIVVKTDGESRSIDSPRSNSINDHYESYKNHAVRSAQE